MDSLQQLGLPLDLLDASETFYNSKTTISRTGKPGDPETEPLKRVTEPEQKRRIIGDTFMKVADEKIAALNLKPTDVYLAQGTLRPDLIESASTIARCLFLPHFRLYEVVSLHMCVFPCKHRNVLKTLPRLD